MPVLAGQRDYRIRVWIKAKIGVDAMLEASSTETRPDGSLVNYRCSYFDTAALAPKMSSVTKPEIGFTNPKVVRDGDWLVISGTMTTANTTILVTLGLIKDGRRVFQAMLGDRLTFGGADIAALS